MLLSNGPEHPLAGLDYQPLNEERTLLYCGVSHPLFDCKKNRIKSLLPKAEFVSRGYMRGADRFGNDLPCKTTATAYHEEGIAHLILSGQFLGYLPEQFAQIWVDKGQMKAVDKRWYSYAAPIMLITKRNMPLTHLADTFTEEVRRVHGAQPFINPNSSE
uniref:Transcriptional regulator, LysR family n=1 Tax=uncultured Thiotrichaceae bacterium TaxID=298394 RepID=A0A6S6U892_9GAMM|nr:MAG: Transcriptional regulator, LysR family [uncultured Thiotrichaceae bacterium]